MLPASSLFVIFIVFVTGLATGFGATAHAKKPATASDGKAVAGALTAGTPKAPMSALLAAADEIVRQVGALRGLAPKKTLQRGVLSRPDIGTKLKARLDQEYAPGEIRSESRVLHRLGLLPPDVDYEKLLLDVLMEQVAGFYDPFTAKLYIADWLPLEMQRPAMAHEIEHALQDQHFGLKQFSTPLKDNGDRQLARAALVEGDGTLLMLEFQAQAMGLPTEQLPDLVTTMGKQMLEMGMASTPIFAKAPAFLKETLIFPYFSGLQLVAQLKRQGGWARVDQAWKSPPETTEQVLHPEKYLAGEKAIPVNPPSLSTQLSGRKEDRRDVLGELGWRILLLQAVPEADAAAAAKGWGGDRIISYSDAAKPDAAPTVLLASAWDSEADAAEAEAAAKKLIARLGGKTAPVAGVVVDPNRDEWLVERHGSRVALLLGAPTGTATVAMAELWRTWPDKTP